MTIAYSELLGRTRERDRSLREKVTSLEAAAALVPDGASVGIGGSTLSRTPLAMIWALIRAGRRDLHCVRSISSSEGELLFAAGTSRHLLTSWFSLGIVWGVSRIMRVYVNRATRNSRNGATWRSACGFAPGRWACRSCRCARCWART